MRCRTGRRLCFIVVGAAFLESVLAGVAQLVERNLAKVEVDGSSPFARSSFRKSWARNGHEKFIFHAPRARNGTSLAIPSTVVTSFKQDG